ncbi:beta-lactamase [Pseudonocardia sp. EC080610-09]|uniref:serine hydrolase n=1 Tax=unclassified Pseudonocardia TaxID=2619320 RepID=UPI0006CAF902|nr:MULTISPECIES: serine hydrolase [unclassified Pseudonocardia]ALE75105.1 beta-lactamase [Pseudonocardia sp. EC080625-04]ALL74463.1 beta-lactamase [Pseudonocardia sp. EC080610-09]ALL81483.1 beta-lactamase [Pseudonocardia sp. EC080619-01]
MTAAAEVRAVFRDAGVRGWLHARPVTSDGSGPGEVAVGADVPVVMASVYKLLVLVGYCRAVDEGRLDPREPVVVPPGRTPGATGISALADPVTMSRRDLVTSMITVSDNVAADVVHAAVGRDRVAALPAELGLTGTRIRGGTADVLAGLVADTGTDDVAAAFAVLADNDVPAQVRALSPVFGSSTTAADATALLARLWRGELASDAGTAFARQVLSAQIWPHRLRAGFPASAAVAGKTGTVGAVRNEVGVVTYPGEHPVAVAVFTHAARSDAAVPRADAAIGAAARTAVNAVRAPAL